MGPISRRAFAGTAAYALLSAEIPRADVGAIATIPTEPGTYSGWPTVARRQNGELVLAWSGHREAHVCPFGRVCFATSSDEGRSWTWPRVVMDSDLDDRDAGIVETGRGTLLITTFTSSAYEPILDRGRGQWSPEKLTRWESARNRRDAEARRSLLGSYMLRSTDGGISWSTPYRVPANSPHGPITVSRDRLLYAGKDLYGGGHVGVWESTDDGFTWTLAGNIPVRPGDRVEEYHELHITTAPEDRLIAHIRNHNAANRGETLQTESSDGGRTWSVPRDVGVWGLPSHLLRMGDSRLLMTYGYRRQPFGNQARVSSDGGRTWSAPITLSSDGVSGDLGYPSTVELNGGWLLTVWYERRPESPLAVLRQVRWRLNGH